jgi:hypothetical protein
MCAVTAAPGAAGVRVWAVRSRGRGPRVGCPPPEGVDVAYPRRGSTQGWVARKLTRIRKWLPCSVPRWPARLHLPATGGSLYESDTDSLSERTVLLGLTFVRACR